MTIFVERRLRLFWQSETFDKNFQRVVSTEYHSLD